jgi:hypothetical protein
MLPSKLTVTHIDPARKEEAARLNPHHISASHADIVRDASEFTTEQARNIIPRDNSYVLDRKFVTIHSEDRDTTLYPKEYDFAVQLPDKMTNVYSMRLIDTILPNNISNVHNSYQNTKLAWKINAAGAALTEPDRNTLQTKYISNVPFTYTVEDGYYTPHQLAATLQAQMRAVITQYVKDNSSVGSSYEYTWLYVRYNSSTCKFDFINTRDKLDLVFDYEFEYDACVEGSPAPRSRMFDQSERWGLPYLLGFDKRTYKNSDFTAEAARVYADPDAPESPEEITPAVTAYNTYTSLNRLSAPHRNRLYSDNTIYIEVERYNNIDEIRPYSTNTKDALDGDYYGMVNSAFAKVVLTRGDNYSINSTGTNTITNVHIFKTMVPSIARLRFTLRWHDGRRVEFDGQPFHMMMEFNQLVDDNVKMDVRLASFYV